MNLRSYMRNLARLALLAGTACEAPPAPASADDTAIDAPDAQDAANTADAPAATCAACTDDSACGNGFCVRPSSTPTSGICRPKCGNLSGACAADARCVGYAVGQSACLPLAGKLTGQLSCKVTAGKAVSPCTGGVTGAFGNLPAAFNAAILQPNLWMGAQVLSLQAALTLGPVGNVNLVLLVPESLAVGKLSYGSPLPLATLHRMGTGAVQAPHLAVGAAGEVEVLSVAPGAGGTTELAFTVDFAEFAPPNAVCLPGSGACLQAGVATCSPCGTGYLPPLTCPSGQGCLAGACKSP